MKFVSYDSLIVTRFAAQNILKSFRYQKQKQECANGMDRFETPVCTMRFWYEPTTDVSQKSWWNNYNTHLDTENKTKR